MTGPLWLHAALAILMIVIAVGCAIRLRLVRGGFDVNCLHALTGVAMAGMLLPELRVLPAPVWEAVFGLGVAWFGWRTLAVRRTGAGPGGRMAGGAPLPHVIECLAMMFMLLPAVDDVIGRSHPFGQAMAGMSGSGLVSVAPAVALLLALCLVGYVVWTTDALARTRAGGGSAGGGSAVAVAGGALAPRLTAFSTIAMTLTMGYMLIQMA